jgi:hypothetical protein
LNSPITPGICGFVAALLLAAPARASMVDVRCARLPVEARAELQARARLLLLGAGLRTAHIGVDCSTSVSHLVWVDGTKTKIDETSGLVEGALDAIENRIARTRLAQAAKEIPPDPPAATAAKEPSPETPAAAELPDGDAQSPFGTGSRNEPAAPERPTPKPAAERGLEGGVTFATGLELWSDSMLVGPRLDVGLGMTRGLAFVIGESARFGVGSPDLGQVMVFDLQTGLALGAPYQARTAIGVIALVGAERLAISSGRFAEGGVWTWSLTGSFGVRGSVALGPIDAWVGAEAILRSATLGTDGPTGVSIPPLSGLICVGGFLPAFSRVPSAPAENVAARAY